MTMKKAFETFLSKLGIAPSDRLNAMPAPEFGALFFEFARRNGYDIANDAKRVLERLDLAIQELVDVGVHDGTPWLYDRYPDARFVLVEPQKDAPCLRHRPATYIVVNAAVGAAPGTLVLTEMGERSSLLDRAGSSTAVAPDASRYEVPVVTLDTILEEHCKSDAIGLKIDVEGFEYFALKGLATQFARVRFIILEVSVRNRFAGERGFGDISALLMHKGFRFYNIMNTARPAPPPQCL